MPELGAISGHKPSIPADTGDHIQFTDDGDANRTTGRVDSYETSGEPTRYQLRALSEKPITFALATQQHRQLRREQQLKSTSSNQEATTNSNDSDSDQHNQIETKTVATTTTTTTLETEAYPTESDRKEIDSLLRPNQLDQTTSQPKQSTLEIESNSSSDSSSVFVGLDLHTKNLIAKLEANPWIETPALPVGLHITNLSHEVIGETLEYFLTCGERLTQMTKTYDDIDAVVKLLQEKEVDLELAARIGQDLLEQNKQLKSSIDELEGELAKRKEDVQQLRHELASKCSLLQTFIEEEEDINDHQDDGAHEGPSESASRNRLHSSMRQPELLSCLGLATSRPQSSLSFLGQSGSKRQSVAGSDASFNSDECNEFEADLASGLARSKSASQSRITLVTSSSPRHQHHNQHHKRPIDDQQATTTEPTTRPASSRHHYPHQHQSLLDCFHAMTPSDSGSQNDTRYSSEKEILQRTDAILNTVRLSERDNEEQRLLVQSVALQLVESNKRLCELQEELAIKSEQNQEQQDRIQRLLAQLRDADRRVNEIGTENVSLQQSIRASMECQKELSDELRDCKRNLSELLSVFVELQQEARLHRRDHGHNDHLGRHSVDQLGQRQLGVSDERLDSLESLYRRSLGTKRCDSLLSSLALGLDGSRSTSRNTANDTRPDVLDLGGTPTEEVEAEADADDDTPTSLAHDHLTHLLQRPLGPMADESLAAEIASTLDAHHSQPTEASGANQQHIYRYVNHQRHSVVNNTDSEDASLGYESENSTTTQATSNSLAGARRRPRRYRQQQQQPQPVIGAHQPPATHQLVSHHHHHHCGCQVYNSDTGPTPTATQSCQHRLLVAPTCSTSSCRTLAVSTPLCHHHPHPGPCFHHHPPHLHQQHELQPPTASSNSAATLLCGPHCGRAPDGHTEAHVEALERKPEPEPKPIADDQVSATETSAENRPDSAASGCGINNSRSLLSNKLRLIKMIEGSKHLKQWERLASLDLGAILQDDDITTSSDDLDETNDTNHNGNLTSDHHQQQRASSHGSLSFDQRRQKAAATVATLAGLRTQLLSQISLSSSSGSGAPMGDTTSSSSVPTGTLSSTVSSPSSASTGTNHVVARRLSTTTTTTTTTTGSCGGGFNLFAKPPPSSPSGLAGLSGLGTLLPQRAPITTSTAISSHEKIVPRIRAASQLDSRKICEGVIASALSLKGPSLANQPNVMLTMEEMRRKLHLSSDSSSLASSDSDTDADQEANQKAPVSTSRKSLVGGGGATTPADLATNEHQLEEKKGSLDSSGHLIDIITVLTAVIIGINENFGEPMLH